MITADEIKKIIDSIKAETSVPPRLFAYTDYEEQKYKEWYPGIEVIRVPLKINIKNTLDKSRNKCYTLNCKYFKPLTRR